MPRLRYIGNFDKGYTRKREGDDWLYFDPDGRRVRAKSVIGRLNALALPPAYEDAWYCPYPNGHIQAVGFDAKGRRQYRYHPDFSSRKDADKYARVLNFAAKLPAIRKQIEKDIRRRDMSADRVVAGVIRLLDIGKIRVGNAQYARDNNSFGATTLRNRHAKVKGAKVLLEYVGKSGKLQRISIEDRRLSTIIKQCHDLPGQALFQYIGDGGGLRAVTSSDVNDYLKRHAGEFTAKDFRTWGASAIAFGTLVRAGEAITLKEMLVEVSAKLGNTPAIARKSYIHPAIIEAVQAGAAKRVAMKLPRATEYLDQDERGLIKFLSKA